ncbi:MAG: putative zinc-binding protein [Planctomycetaceae bacterium]|nr:putative zinc-binding protein [Planctomycetaceae bacterium]
MGETYSKVGIISCSGEEIPEGTIARQAVRRVLEALRPQDTVTLCLPLFLAGEEGERRFAREHPTITVDGCLKLCAKQGTEKYSGKVNTSLVVSDILGDSAKGCCRSTRHTNQANDKAVWLVAERIASEVDALARSVRVEPGNASAEDGACCACSKPSQGGKLEINGTAVTISGLPLIFDHLKKKGLQPGSGSGDTLLQNVKVYHAIEPEQEAAYRNALASAYQTYCGQTSQCDLGG